MVYLLHHLLERSARMTPEAPAFRYLENTLSFRELDHASSQLAHQLSQLGVQRKDRVGIYLNKSLECAIAIYGILKVGAAYVPLDPGAPGSRLGLIIRDCGIRCLVSHQARRAGVTELVAMTDSPLTSLIGMAEPLPGALQQVSWGEIGDTVLSAPPPECGSTSDDAAYIIYTSGSTGVPKGIIHSHGSGLSYACMAADLYAITPEDRLSNLPPLHFDQSIFDYFSGTAAGACTVIIPEAYAKLPASLSELIQRERLTIWYSVPFALIQLLLHGVLIERDLSALRLVLYGGEPFPPKYLAELMARWSQASFCNVYGPAEVNQCTFHTLSRTGDGELPAPPIGLACPNVELLVVDESDQQVPPEEVGELLIRSPTMMRGYYKRTELNDAAFYHRRNDDNTLDRFYRSGDLVREDAQGLLHFIGRKDRQVKLRGFRIELDEVEAVLSRHPAVEEAACVLTGADQDRRSLEASVTLNGSASCDDKALRRYATQHLQQYAVPERINILAAFPRTSTGKIDRKQLVGYIGQLPTGQGQEV